jgi:alkyl hydroperoxide reductase subunit F
MYEFLIIGGGPAGMTAAVYAARKKLSTLLVTQELGGQVNENLRVENYMGYQFIEGPELMEKFETQLRQYPIEVKLGIKVTDIRRIEGGLEAVTDSGLTYAARAVVFATGKRSRELGIPGEERLRGRGVTYCSVCDGPLFSGEKVAIIGGGNSALSAAQDMLRLSPHIYLVSLTPLTADRAIIENASGAPNLTILIEHRTEEVLGNEQVEGILVRDLKSGEEKRLEVKGVFVEIGLLPNSAPVARLVKLNERGEVPVNKNCETVVPGLYAAGDVTDAPEKQIVVACGEGAKAALQAHRYLQKLKR